MICLMESILEALMQIGLVLLLEMIGVVPLVG